jgi:hypothetical protein
VTRPRYIVSERQHASSGRLDSFAIGRVTETFAQSPATARWEAAAHTVGVSAPLRARQLTSLAYGYAVAGEQAGLAPLLKEMEQRAREGYVPPFNMAVWGLGPGKGQVVPRGPKPASNK